MSKRFPRPAAFGAAVLLLTTAGCGGKGADVSDATVIPDPTVTASSPTAGAPAAGTTAPTTSTAAAPATTTATISTAAPVKAEGWGTLKGRVTFEGAAPTVKILVAKGDAGAKDAAVCAKSDVKSERLVVDAASKGVKNVIVYIPKPTAVNPDAKAAKATAKVVFDQKNCVFEPHVLAVMTNAKIDLQSSDPVGHNINSKIPTFPLNAAMAPLGHATESPVAAARQPGLVVCDIHPWMTAWWLVTDSPYFAVTDDKGNFEIKNAPAGTQKVAVWQESTAYVTPSTGQDVTIAAGGDTTQDFKIDAAKVKPEQ